MQTLGQNNKKKCHKNIKGLQRLYRFEQEANKKTTRSLRKQKSHILKKEILRNNRIAAI